MLRGKEGIMSLAQGIVHWAPPAAALEARPRTLESWELGKMIIKVLA